MIQQTTPREATSHHNATEQRSAFARAKMGREGKEEGRQGWEKNGFFPQLVFLTSQNNNKKPGTKNCQGQQGN